MYSMWVDSVTAIQFDPEFDITNRSSKNQSEHRTRGGKQFTYRWGGVVAFKFGIRFVDSSFASTLNQWWIDNRDIKFAEDSSHIVYSLRMINEKPPIREYISPYDTLYSGVVELESYMPSRNSCIRNGFPSGDYGSIVNAVTVSEDMGSIAEEVTNCEIDYGVIV